MDIFEELETDVGIIKAQPETPELGLFQEYTTEGKYKKIYNVQHWLKHQLFVYAHFQEKNWIVSKPFKEARLQVSVKEITRALLEYYFLMACYPRFVNDRAKEQGKLVDMGKFLDMVIEYPTIKKLIEDPRALI